MHNKKVRATTDSDGMDLELSYDKLVIAVGAQPNTFGIPGVQENALFLKEAEDSAKLHAKLLCNLEKAAALNHQGDKYRSEIDRLLKVVVVGGGPTGKFERIRSYFVPVTYFTVEVYVQHLSQFNLT